MISLYYSVNLTLFFAMFFIFADILSNLFDLKGCVFKCTRSFYLLSVRFHSHPVPESFESFQSGILNCVTSLFSL